MVDKLVSNYIIEVKNKIALKMIPNKTEEQILYLNFKYCDLSNSGQCNLRDFIKTNERIGVVMPKIKDLETIFHYFDKEDSDSLDYRAFSRDLFKADLTHLNSNHRCKAGEAEKAPNFFGRLQSVLLAQGGNLALINFAKELLLIDSSNSYRISLDDLLRVCADCKIKLTNDDVQLLFHSFELFNNGIFNYTRVLNQLKSSYWNEERESIAKEFFSSLSSESKSISIDQFKKRYKGEDKEEFNRFIDDFKYIMKYRNGSAPLNQKDLTEFVKYYGFGLESNDDLSKILSSAFISNSSSAQMHFFTKPINEKREEDEPLQAKAQTAKFAVFDQLKLSLSKFGKKTLFNFIKHFKYYDNGTKFISKYDFVKVLKDFNIHLPIIEIENLFEQFSKDKFKTSLNYDLFISDLITSSLNEVREGVILDTYDVIEEYAESINVEVTIDFLKGLYNSKNDPRGKDDNELLIEFNECIELFLFGYKGNRANQVSKEDFAQFYCFIAFLVYSDEDLIEMLRREWSKCFKRLQKDQPIEDHQGQMKAKSTFSSSQKRPVEEVHTQQDLCSCSKEENSKQSFNRKPNNQARTTYTQQDKSFNSPQQPLNSKDDPLNKLKQKLKERGIRGLIYLHKQFLLSCPDLNAIQFETFVQILSIQHIKLQRSEYQAIFDMFPLEVQKGRINFHNFIRAFKKELNAKRQSVLEECFVAFEKEHSDHIPIDLLKLRYDASQHPDCLLNKKSEDEVAMEFIDCIEQSYSLLGSDEDHNDGYMTFEMFANFYEYVSFLYENDNDFEEVVRGTWRI